MPEIRLRAQGKHKEEQDFKGEQQQSYLKERAKTTLWL